jgi:hypothetical protein
MPTPPQRTDNRQYQQQPQNRPQYQQPQYQQPGRQAPQSQMTRPTPHTFSPNEGNFDPRAASQRGQASRQPPPPQRSAPQPRAQSRPAPAPRGGDRRKP